MTDIRQEDGSAADEARVRLMKSATVIAKVSVLAELLDEEPRCLMIAESIADHVERLLLRLVRAGVPMTDTEARCAITLSVRGWVQEFHCGSGPGAAGSELPEAPAGEANELSPVLRAVVDLATATVRKPRYRGATSL